MNGLICSYCGGAIQPGRPYCRGCGTEPPSQIIRAESVSSSIAAETAISSDLPLEPIPSAGQPSVWTERQWRIFELVLVCAVAFAASILSSGESFLTGNYANSARKSGEMTWIYSMIRQGTVLALLWYVLRRRSKDFRDLGLRWNLKEAGFGCLLFIGGVAAAMLMRVLIGSMAIVLNWELGPQPHVSQMLFGSHVAVMAFFFNFLNPFFEELIARAFVMTELKALTQSTAIAIAGSVLLQTSYHFYQGAPAAISHGATFLVFALYYAKTNRIGAPIVAHLLLDLYATINYMAKLGQYHF